MFRILWCPFTYVFTYLLRISPRVTLSVCPEDGIVEDPSTTQYFKIIKDIDSPMTDRGSWPTRCERGRGVCLMTTGESMSTSLHLFLRIDRISSLTTLVPLYVQEPTVKLDSVTNPEVLVCGLRDHNSTDFNSLLVNLSRYQVFCPFV